MRARRGNAWQPFDVFDMEAFLGASNLYVSAADLARWASANAAGTALPADVVSAGKPSAITGRSWYCDDTRARCYYTGSLNAFHSLVYWDRERNESVALVTNSTMQPWQLISLQRNLVEALAGRLTPVEAPTKFSGFSSDTQPRAAVTCRARGGGVATIEAGSGGLEIQTPLFLPKVARQGSSTPTDAVLGLGSDLLRVDRSPGERHPW